MGQNHSPKALHYDWSECNLLVVTQKRGTLLLLGTGIETVLVLKQVGTAACAMGRVKDGGTYISKYCSTCLGVPSGDVIWACCIVGVNSPQDFAYTS